MKKNRADGILKIAAGVCVLVFAIGVLIYGLATDFGFADFVKPAEDGGNVCTDSHEEKVKALYEIHVDWVSGPVTVAFYDGTTVKVTETAGVELAEDEKLYMEVSGGELSVRWNSAWPFNDRCDSPKQLEIRIPEQFADGLELVSIQTVSGDVYIDALKAAEASFETVSGELHLSHITAENLKVQSTSGDVFCADVSGTENLEVGSTSGNIAMNGITGGKAELDNTSGRIAFTGTLTELECGTVSGEMELDFAVWPQKMDIHTVSGHVDILAPETEAGFLCRFSGVSGDFSSDFSMQRSGSLYQCGQGAYSVELETTSGNIALNRKVG